MVEILIMQIAADVAEKKDLLNIVQPQQFLLPLPMNQQPVEVLEVNKKNFYISLIINIPICLGMPTIEEVCSTFGLSDVDIEYSESDFQNLTNYKLFQQHVRPLLTKENPKVSFCRLLYNVFLFLQFVCRFRCQN